MNPQLYPNTWLANELRAAGLPVYEVPGWTGNVTHDGLGDPQPFGPMAGMLWHSTTSPQGSGEFPSLPWMLSNAEFPGPKVQLLIGRPVAGAQLARVAVLGSGRANHAGTGGPLDGVAADNANPVWCGMEFENDNLGEPYPAAQLATGRRAAAVVLRHVPGGVLHLWFHRDWTTRKSDPRGLIRATERAAVAALLATPPARGKDDPVLLYQISDKAMKGFAVGPDGVCRGVTSGPKMLALRALRYADGRAIDYLVLTSDECVQFGLQAS